MAEEISMPMELSTRNLPVCGLSTGLLSAVLTVEWSEEIRWYTLYSLSRFRTLSLL